MINNDDKAIRENNYVVIEVEDDAAITRKLKAIMEDGQKVSVRTDQKSLPIWFDPEKFKRGQEYFKRNYFVMFVAKLSGLLLVLSVPSTLKVLVFTGKSSEPGKAFRRYMDTICHMRDWYFGDISDSESDLHKSLIKVRGLHCCAARKSVSLGGGTISQMDMVLTQFGFMGICLSKRDYLGMKGDDKDVEGFIHFWKTVGYLMGIEDRYNLCDGNTDQVSALCEKVRSEVFKSFMQTPPDDFTKMSKALLSGVQPVIPFLNTDAFLEFTRQMVDLKSGIPLTGCYARFILRFQIFVHTVLFTVSYLAVVFKPVFNFLMKLAIFLHSNYPFLAYITLGNDVYPEEKSTSSKPIVSLNKHNNNYNHDNHNNNTPSRYLTVDSY